MPVKTPIDTEDALTRRKPASVKHSEPPIHTTYFDVTPESSDSDMSWSAETQKMKTKKEKKTKKERICFNWQAVKKNEKLAKNASRELDEIQNFLFFSHENKLRMKIVFAYLEESFFLTNGKHHDLLDEMEELEGIFDEEECHTTAGTGKEYCDLNVD